ncbi:ATP-binding protein [Sutterella wadsworthensis]|uniref:ATP-binding protein n=1 Tax=Sutterella wadsworthensis TaxID=40545 RepID=UPI003967A11C
MKIKSVKIKNFRGYRDEICVDFDNLTVLIGKNDIGKSTILEALDIFFNEGSGIVKWDKSDLNVQAIENGENETIISVCFTELPENIVIDSTVQTDLSSEYMLNAAKDLEVIKKFKTQKPSIFIKAFHPTNPECCDLLLKKNADLKNVASKLGIECENLSTNSKIRKTIWAHFNSDLNIREVEIDIAKEDAKKIWENLSSYIPQYSLFQADRRNSDDDSEVQDPLKMAVKEILADEEIKDKLNSVADTVKERLQEVADRTLKKLNEMDSGIASTLHPVISTDKLKWSDVFKNVSISGDEEIPINKRGSGVKRLVLLNFFRAEAERRAEEKGNTGIIYAIEEPETSQHNNHQRTLIAALKELSAQPHTQILLTTHSAVLVKELDYNNIRLLNKNDLGETKVTKVEQSALNYPSLNEVNYLAYDEITEEYHNELYGYLEEFDLLSAYKEFQSDIPELKYFNTNTNRTYDSMLSRYIRDQIHHPENQVNVRFSQEQLEKSAIMMRNFIINLKNKKSQLTSNQ